MNIVKSLTNNSNIMKWKRRRKKMDFNCVHTQKKDPQENAAVAHFLILSPCNF